MSATHAEEASVTPTAPLGGTALTDAERRRAYVAALQRDLNVHLERMGAPERLAIDGRWDDFTVAAFASVCRRLGFWPQPTARVFRLIAGAAASRTEAERDAARKDREGRRPGRIVLGGPSLAPEERRRAYVAALQRDLNRHLIRLGSPAVLAVDGRWGTHTARAFRLVSEMLGIAPEPSTRACRIIGGALVPRTPAELAEAAQRGTALERTLVARFAREISRPRPAPTRPSRRPRPTPPTRRPRMLAAAIDAHGGRWGDTVVLAAHATGLAVPLICAVIEKESGFANVFGHDGGPHHTNPVKSPPGGTLTVTEGRYREYKRHRRLGQGAQGVGPMQLTSPAYQDRADELGGCWRPEVNVQVGAAVLIEKMRTFRGRRAGIRAYNGSGPAAEAYADHVLRLEREWHARLTKATAAHRTTTPIGAKLREPTRAHSSRRPAAPSLAVLLAGHRAPAPPGLRRLISVAHRHGLVVTSTNDGQHATGSYHYRNRAVDFGLPAGEVGTAAGRDRMVAFQRRLARRPGRFAELFGPDNRACVKSGRPIVLAEGSVLESMHDNHVHVAI